MNKGSLNFYLYRSIYVKNHTILYYKNKAFTRTMPKLKIIKEVTKKVEVNKYI